MSERWRSELTQLFPTVRTLENFVLGSFGTSHFFDMNWVVENLFNRIYKFTENRTGVSCRFADANFSLETPKYRSNLSEITHFVLLPEGLNV